MTLQSGYLGFNGIEWHVRSDYLGFNDRLVFLFRILVNFIELYDQKIRKHERGRESERYQIMVLNLLKYHHRDI